MRVTLSGEVVKIQDASWTNSGGQLVESYDVYVRQDDSDPAYGADRFQCAGDKKPEVGERGEYRISVQAKTSKAGKGYMSVFLIDRKVTKAAPSVKAA